MFTCPVSGSGIGTSRPTASTGTITNAANAYDLPASRADDPPYSTSADRATVTGSAVAGTPDFVIVEYNTFPTRSKANFTQCQLVIGYSSLLNAVPVATTSLGSGRYNTDYVTSSLTIDFQVNGSTWVNIKTEDCIIGTRNAGIASNSFTVETGRVDTLGPDGTVQTVTAKNTINITIPSTSFTSNMTDLKIRFRLGTCTNSLPTAYTSSGSYNIWDIRANLS